MTYDRNEVRRTIEEAMSAHPSGPAQPVDPMNPDLIDLTTAMMGLPPEVGELAKDIAKNGMPCHRCEALIQAEGLYDMFAFTADTPAMNTPSPPTILCQKCGYLTAAFMGIKAAAEVCEKHGWRA